jgi:hypothetical protein
MNEFEVINSSNGRDRAQSPYLVLVDPQDVLFRYLEGAQRKGFRTLVLALDPQATRAGERRYNTDALSCAESRIDLLVECDTGRAEAIVRALEPFMGQVAGLLPGDDAYVPSALAAGRAMGFDYAAPQDAVCQQSKSAMKRRLTERGVPTPDFRLATSVREAEDYWSQLGGDCMIKMVDYCDSANVSRVTDKESVRRAWESIIKNALQIEVPFTLAREALLEEVVEGRELSAEGYVQDDRVTILNYCEKITTPNFIVVGHILPAALSPGEQLSVRRVVADCLRALGVRNSVFHAEVHVRGGEPYVIECAVRPPGQHVVDLIAESSGHDLMDIAIDLATGRTTTAQAGHIRRHYAIFALFAQQSGTLTAVDGLDQLCSRGGVRQVHLEVKPGDQVEALTTFRHRYGFVVLEDDHAAGIREKAAWLRSHVRLAVAPRMAPLAESVIGEK